jgi:lipopolysaccharide transport system ATP-binding protein
MERARVRLETLVRGVEILVLSSHVPDVVLQWCTRAVWMDQGRVRADGPTAEVLEQYMGYPVQMSEWARARSATGLL